MHDSDDEIETVEDDQDMPAVNVHIDDPSEENGSSRRDSSENGGVNHGKDELMEPASVLGDNLPWVEKYRPNALTDLISHQHIIATMTNLIEKNKMPHMLLYGPPGTGKTSTILACARKINGPKYASMTLELNASDDRGIDVIRDRIIDFASSRRLFNDGLKLVILDEADSMTKIAQFALRRVIEKYTKSTRFCLICNYINKIIPALQSRCTRFRFGPLENSQIEVRLTEIARAEHVAMDPAGLQAILKLSSGDMRKCLNILQACHLSTGEVSEKSVYLVTGKPIPSDVEHILHLLLNTPCKEAFDGISAMQTEKGLSLTDIVAMLHLLVVRVTMPSQVMMFVLSKLADVEYRLSQGTSEKAQLGALVGIFQIAADMTAKHGAT